jgi:hypothetical protein
VQLPVVTRSDGHRAAPILLAACAVSIGLGLTFVFVKAPHPWGWEGFDNYRQLGLALARGEMYPTLEVPWGYPAFLAIFYRAFGDRQWIPLVVQVLLNGLVPLMLYVAVRGRLGEREALVTAVLIGWFSFNTIYASTQASDALCTVLYAATIALFLRAQMNARVWTFAAAGVIGGVAMQVRPNMLLLPLWLAAVSWMLSRPRPAAVHLAVFVVAAFLVITPWVVRNERLAGRFIPASAHGGIQLWYGSLQVGSFFTHWFDNPREVFGERTFDYSEPDGRDLIVSVGEHTGGNCVGFVPQTVALTFWTDRNPARTALPFQSWRAGGVQFAIPAQPNDTAVYYYFDATWASSGASVPQQTPVAGPYDPLVHFVTTNHFGDSDRHADMVDIFDIVRMIGHDAWHEPLADASKLDFDRDGSITSHDLDIAVGVMESDKNLPVAVPVRGLVLNLVADDRAATLAFRDGSTLVVPRAFSGSVLDLDPRGPIARGLTHSRRSFRSADLSAEQVPAVATYVECFRIAGGVNQVFYRAQPQSQDRYVQLALDDIRRTPVAYALASARRMIGIFVIVGSDSPGAAHQFLGSRLLYAAGQAVSVTVLVLFVAGMVIAWRRRADAVLLTAAILYVPITIAPFLTNSRYSMSVQPFVFAFVAVALVAMYDRLRHS